MELTHSEYMYVDSMVSKDEFPQWYDMYKKNKSGKDFRDLTAEEQLGACYDFEAFLWEID